MFKLFAAILIAAVCMSSAVQGTAVKVSADATTQIQNLNPFLADLFGHEIGYPLLAPNLGPLTSFYASALGARNYIAQSNPVLFRGPLYDQFIGESSLGIVVV